VKITIESDKWFQCPTQRLSYAEKSEVQKMLDANLASGYIRPSESECGGELRMCVDYRRLNKVTLKDNSRFR